jgi:hypothetical protein
MDFLEAELRYQEWKKMHRGGQIDDDTFEARVDALSIAGPDGCPWHIGINTGLWYRLEGDDWIEDNPHHRYAQAAASLEPPPPPRESPAPGAPTQNVKARPKGKVSSLTIVLVILGALICLGSLAIAVLYSGLMPVLLATATPKTADLAPFPTPPAETAAPAVPLSTVEFDPPRPEPSKAAQSPTRTVFYEDDFSDESSGWQDIRVGENFDTLYFEGGYLIVVTTKGYNAQADPGVDFPGAVQVEVDAVQKTGSPYDEYGLLCHYTKNSDGTGSYYYLAIAGDGLGVIYKVDHDRKTLLLTEPPADRSDIIHPAKQVNRLRADCLDGGSLLLVVNGVEIASADDNSFTGGGAGLRADSEAGETEIRFDNFTVFQP